MIISVRHRIARYSNRASRASAERIADRSRSDTDQSRMTRRSEADNWIRLIGSFRFPERSNDIFTRSLTSLVIIVCQGYFRSLSFLRSSHRKMDGKWRERGRSSPYTMKAIQAGKILRACQSRKIYASPICRSSCSFRNFSS